MDPSTTAADERLREARRARYTRRSERRLQGALRREEKKRSGVDNIFDTDRNKIDPDDTSTHTSDSSMDTDKARKLLGEAPPQNKGSDDIITPLHRGTPRKKTKQNQPAPTPAPVRGGPTLTTKSPSSSNYFGSTRVFVLLTACLIISLLTMYFAGKSSTEMMHNQLTIAKIKANIHEGGPATLAPSQGQFGEAEGRSPFEVVGEHLGAHIAGGGGDGGVGAGTLINKKRNAIKDITSSNRFAISRASPPHEPPKGWKSRPSNDLKNLENSRFISVESEKAALGDDSSPAWCETEMIPFIFQNVTTGDWGGAGGGDEGGPVCKPDRPTRMGNFSSPVDLTLHQHFPVVNVRKDLDSATAADLQAYWRDYPKGLIPKCYPCKGTLFHNVLYTLRRWFRVEKWFVEDMVSGSNAFVVDQNFIVTFKLPQNTFSGAVESESPEVQVAVSKITKIHITPALKRPSIWFMVITTSQGTPHAMEMKGTAIKSFLRTITYLHPKLVGLVQVLDSSGVLTEQHQLSSSSQNTSSTSSAIALSTKRFLLQVGIAEEVDTTDTSKNNKVAVEADADEVAGGGGNANKVEAAIVKSQGNKVEDPREVAALTMKLVEPKNALEAAKLVSTASGNVAWKKGILEGTLLPSKNEPWPYLPCSTFDVTKLVKDADKSGTLGKRREFWPYKCESIRESKCGEEEEIAQRRKGLEKVPLRVALALAGFIRSFPRARHVIYENIVKTNRATVFVATWNVIGRIKKTEPVQKKQMLPLKHVFEKVSEWMQLEPTVNASEFISILNYKAEFWMMEHNIRHGFPHGGLYYCQSKVLELVRQYQPQGHFDVIIRSRMDVYPVSPLYISRIWKHGAEGVDRSTMVANLEKQAVRGELLALPVDLRSQVEYVLNMGASCKLDEVWWPQYATFSDDKILKSYQDTRFKLYGWQVCDWIEIGTTPTILILEGIYDYAVDNYVFAVAQWLDHAYYVHHQIAYQVVNPFLKIMRHGSAFFG